MNLFIVESPGKVKKIQGYLGSGYRVMASVGHVRDLPVGDIGVEPPAFKPKYVPTERGKDVLKKLAAVAKEASNVYLATDPDREGEAIAWHLKEALKLKKYERITYQEITEQAVKKAMATPRQLNMELVAAQETRRVLDRLVGYMVSPVLSERLCAEKFLSAGRVQSPAVRLVVEREREIQKFKVTNHFGVEMLFEGPDGIWHATWLPKQHGSLAKDQEYVLDKGMAEQIASQRLLCVLDCQESVSKIPPPAPFITSTLQQAASSALKMSPKDTMRLAQRLYEQGHITYMRTDSPNLSKEAIADIRDWAAQHGFAVPESSRTWKSKAGAQEAHEAIRPTHIEAETAGETDEEKSLYKLIRLRAIASQLEDALYDIRVVSLESNVGGKKASFEAKGRTLKKQGWKALVATDETEESEPEADNPVPKLHSGNELTANETKVIEKKTKPPARYTEATLIKELERRGIGRPSTYAAILENIIVRHYLRIEKRCLFPEPLGEQIIDTMIGKFAFLDYGYTKRIEEDLDRIAEGSEKYHTVVTEAHGQLVHEMDSFGVVRHTCPKCGKFLRHLVRAESKGQKAYDFWSCTGYPDCKTSFDNKDGKPDFEGKKRFEKEPTR
ncbi:MAG: type I DNA topoisomerase [Syntrophobacteraceae bacterium]